jgi:hypothetical protein
MILHISSSAESHSLQDTLETIFASPHFDTELIFSYPDCLRCLPLDLVEPAFLLRYLPPGTNTRLIAKSPFWQQYFHLIEKPLEISDIRAIFEDICREYVFDLE